MTRKVAAVPDYGSGVAGWRRLLTSQGDAMAELGVGGAERLGEAPTFYLWVLRKAHLLPGELLVGGRAALPLLPEQQVAAAAAE